jgi:hypothetical protein
MAKKSFKEKFEDFISDRKKLTLLLLLLGGGGVITTSVALLASNPASSQSSGSSQTTTSSAGTTSNVVNSSQPLISLDGNLPDLELDNAEIQFDGSGGLNFGFDRIYNIYYNQNYYYQTGINFFEGVDTTEYIWDKGYIGIIAYNFETNEIDFEYTFDPGQVYIDAVVNEDKRGVDFASISAMEIYDGYMYVLYQYMTLQNTDVHLGGDYTKLYNYISDTSGLPSTSHNVMLRFDLLQPTDYEIIFAKPTNGNTGISGFTFLNDEIHILGTNYNFNNRTIDGIFDFISSFDLPITIHESEQFISYSVHPLNEDLSFDDQRFIHFFEAESTSTSNYNILYSRFVPVSKGLIYSTFDENDNPYISIDVHNGGPVANLTNVEERISELESISGVSNEDLGLIKESLGSFYEYLDEPDYFSNTNSFSVGGTMTGLFSLEDKEFSFILHTSSNQWYQNVENILQVQTFSNLIQLDEGYLITTSMSKFVYESLVVNQIVFDSPSFVMLDTQTEVSQYNPVTKQKTTISLDVDSFYWISGIYPRDGGYYLTGTLIEDETNNIDGLAAGLFLLDESFSLVDSLVLDGSKSDTSNILTINSSGQLIWMIFSSSIDGDFEGAENFNINEEYNQYVVIF